jgi:hypothetical protein
LVDENGVIITGTMEKLIGQNYLEKIANSGMPGSGKIVELLKARLSSNEEGKIDLALPDESKGGFLTRFLIATTPVYIGEKHWLLAVATPVNDALTFVVPFYFRNLALAGLALLGFLVIGIRIAKIRGYQEGIEEEHKEHGELTTKK